MMEKLDIKNIERTNKTNEFVPSFSSTIVCFCVHCLIRGNWARAIKIEKTLFTNNFIICLILIHRQIPSFRPKTGIIDRRLTVAVVFFVSVHIRICLLNYNQINGLFMNDVMKRRQQVASLYTRPLAAGSSTNFRMIKLILIKSLNCHFNCKGTTIIVITAIRLLPRKLKGIQNEHKSPSSSSQSPP